MTNEPASLPDDAEDHLCSDVVELEDGTSVQVCQQNSGPGVEVGGGEHPDPHTGPATGVRPGFEVRSDGVIDPAEGFEREGSSPDR